MQEELYLHKLFCINFLHTNDFCLCPDILGHGSAERAYEIFRSLGLRSILVVDKHSHPIGIIMRHELALLEEIGENEHKVEEKKIETFLYSQSQRHLNAQFE